mgnify:CR=1 FL=1
MLAVGDSITAGYGVEGASQACPYAPETSNQQLTYAALAAGSVAAASAALVWAWLVPLLLGAPFLRAYLLAEHGACPLVADMLMNTRTTFTNRLVRFLAWNMPYHTAHHVLPVVPFHRLAALTALLERRLATTAGGYLDAHRQIRAGWPRRSHRLGQVGPGDPGAHH